MEKLNLHYNDGKNIIKSICWIMAYLSWLLLLVNGWVSMRWLFNKSFKYIWTIYVFRERNYHPLQMYYFMIYFVFIFAMIIITIG